MAAIVVLSCAAGAPGGDPTELLPGEAPVVFTGAEGEDADATLLADGSPIRGDEIWLWAPTPDRRGQVDLSATAQFFRIWDSGPEAGPDGNDDDDNGMRGMDFDPSTGTFLISYEDTTTTGGSTLDALDIVESAGGKVARVLCLVDRGEGAADAFAERGVTLEPIFTRADLPV